MCFCDATNNNYYLLHKTYNCEIRSLHLNVIIDVTFKAHISLIKYYLNVLNA